MAEVDVENIDMVRRNRGRSEMVVAVAVDKCSKSSRDALRWAVDHVLDQGQVVMLVHVDDPTASPALPPYGNNEMEIRREPDERAMDVLNPYVCFCLMRQVECEPVVLQHTNVAEALREFGSFYGVKTLVLGGVVRHWATRIFRGPDVLTILENTIPSFCNIYGIHNGVIRNSNSTACPFRPPIRRVTVEETISSEHVAPDQEWSAEASVPVSPSASAPNSTYISRISSITQAEEVEFSFIHSERLSTDSSFITFYKSLGSKGVFLEAMNKSMIKDFGDHSRRESATSCHPDEPVSLALAA